MARAVPAQETVPLPPLALRATVVPSSINAEARTADLVFSTGAGVDRFDFFSGERWVETLSMAPQAIRLERLNNGAPFLNAHSAFSVADQLGVVEPGSARLVEGRAVATVRFSKRAEVEPIWQDVKDRIVSNVSVGYRVHKYERTPAQETTPEIRHAVDWEPYEISAVPMGADDGAKFRSDAERAAAPCLIVTRVEEVRRMEPIAIAPAAEPEAQPDPPPELSDRERGVLQERERVEGIIAGAIAVGRRRDDPVTLAMIRDGMSLSDARGKFLEMIRLDGRPDAGPRPGPSGAARVTRDPLESAWEGIKGAFLHRLFPAWFPLEEHAKAYRTYSIVRCAEEVLEQRGLRTRHLSPSMILGLALGLEERVGYHTTSDFKEILADVTRKALRKVYAEAPQTWLPLASRVTLPDFKTSRRIQLGDAPALKKVLEHGEFTRGTIGEGKEQYALATYGRIFGITRQALINDDLDAFGRIPLLFGRAARNLESDLVWGEILKNPLMADGLALFEAAVHKNLITPGTYISISSLGVARAMLARQKSLDGTTYQSLSGRYLVVPPGQQTLAEQYTTSVNPTISGSVNPFTGLSVITEPRLEGGIVLPDGTSVAGDALAWYMFASPDQIDIIEYAYLDGEEGPSLDSRIGFDIDGLEIKCRLDFAAKVIDYRGGVKNVGATLPTALLAPGMVLVDPSGHAKPAEPVPMEHVEAKGKGR